jgi:NAD(P)-dependent dehydrogenase (short-subunit alcohol dehydrogenase family)
VTERSFDGRPLSGRLALVTGASRGIGAATAEVLGRAGAHVILTARTAGALEEVEDRIHAAGGSATIAPLDMVEGDSIARLAAAISGRWSALDILVLNAATLGSLAPVPAVEGKEFASVMTLNVLAQHNMIAAFDTMLRASTSAAVIGVTSSVATAPRAYWGAYAASKAALETLLLTYADEVKAISAIRVAIVDPGATATRMRARAFPGEDAATLKPPLAVADAIFGLVQDGFETGKRIRVPG